MAGDRSVPERLPKRLRKALKVDEIIAQRSAVPAVSLRKRPGDKTTDGVIPEKRRRTNYVTVKELVQLKKVADGHHESVIEIADATHDPWAVSAEPDAPYRPEGEFSFLPKAEAAKAPQSLKQKPISLAASGKAVPAVQKPRGGHSYNPVFTDYEGRLIEESEKALDSERKRIEVAEAERIKREAAARSAAEADAAEARAELSEWDEDSAWEGFESGAEEPAKSKRPERMTPAQRNKAKRRREQEQKRRHEAAMSNRNAETHRIKAVAKEVAGRELALALAKVEMSDDSEDGDDEELRRRQLGKFRLPEKDLELVLPDELQDSLRLLKPEGNLLKDRYRSMIVRGKMESRRKIPFRKEAKSKITEKWTHKDFRI